MKKRIIFIATAMCMLIIAMTSIVLAGEGKLCIVYSEDQVNWVKANHNITCVVDAKAEEGVFLKRIYLHTARIDENGQITLVDFDGLVGAGAELTSNFDSTGLAYFDFYSGDYFGGAGTGVYDEATGEHANVCISYMPKNSTIRGWKEGMPAAGWAYFDKSGNPLTGWQKISGTWYYFDELGWMQTGAVDINGKVWLFKSNGALVTSAGWFKNNVWWADTYESWFYSKSTGEAVKGWKQISGKWYYFDKKTAAMVTGAKKIDGVDYVFGNNGAMLTNTWYQDEEGLYYRFNASGLKVKGWQKINNVWYYFDKTDCHMLSDEVKVIDGIEYKFSESGKLYVGWAMREEVKVYYSTSGLITESWQKIGSDWYYLTETGEAMVGWAAKTIDKNTYYFDENGAMQTGWVEIDTDWYYFDKSGAMKTGWLKSGSAYYYLKSDGTMAADEWVEDGKYYLDERGIWIKNKAK